MNMNRKSGLADIVLIALIAGCSVIINGMLARSRCNVIRVEGSGNTINATLSPQGGDTVSVPLSKQKLEGVK